MLHADDALIVVDKPAGLLAVPGRGEAGRDNLAARVQAQFADALVVHRLDMATSGLMLFARGAAAQRRLSMAFASGEVAKQYVAVVEGRLHGDSGAIDAPLAADWPHRPRQVVDLRARQALADALAGAGARRRQHAAAAGARSPAARTSCACTCSGSATRSAATRSTRPLPLRADRLLLHATRLALAHPRTGSPCHFDSDPRF